MPQQDPDPRAPSYIMPTTDTAMSMSLVERVRASQLPSPATRKAIRERAGATFAEIAAELGVTPVSVLRWEAGTAKPRRDLAIAYRRLLNDLDEACGSVDAS